MVSVITVCLNAQNCIEKTLQSVLTQKDADIEYIIKDGGSSDDTNEIVKAAVAANTNERIKVKHVIESDSGIYDAMNAAADIATGEWIIYMNAGDCFYDEYVIRNAMLYADDGADVLFGNTVYSMKLCDFPQIHFANTEENKLSVGHQSCFYSAAAFREYRFNTDYKIAADHDQLRRLFFDGKKFVHMNMFVGVCDREGVSNQRSDRHFDEVYMIEHGGVLNKDKKYRRALFVWRAKAAIAKAFPDLENARYCLNNLKRNRYACPKNSSSSIMHKQ